MRNLIVCSVLAVLSTACANGGDEGGDIIIGGGKDTGVGSGGDGTAGGDTNPGLGDVALDTAVAPEASADAFWADDPPPKTCGDGGVAPIVPGGTPECPDDKNREGCPCLKEGAEAACWPGLRKNRNRGVCHDGKTICKRIKEGASMAWGPCEGYTLPTPGGVGKDACQCFSGGTWKLDNLSPCFWKSGGSYTGSTSTTLSGTTAACPATFDAPKTSWSRTTVTVDCAGHFKLCYTIKAGDAKDPKPTDCVVTSQCAEGDYITAGVEQKWGDLPGWKSTDGACAQKFDTTGGYGEMSVDGLSAECDAVKKVFNRVTYCSSACATKPTAPECAGCGAGGGGSF